MRIIKCDLCGADHFKPEQMEKGQVIFTKRSQCLFVDLCPNCYKNNFIMYVGEERRE